MPTLLNLNGFKFFFYSNEHEPKHVHIMKGEAWAKVNLDDLSVIFSSLKAKDLNFVLSVLEERKNDFIGVWNEYFER